MADGSRCGCWSTGTPDAARYLRLGHPGAQPDGPGLTRDQQTPQRSLRYGFRFCVVTSHTCRLRAEYVTGDGSDVFDWRKFDWTSASLLTLLLHFESMAPSRRTRGGTIRVTRRDDEPSGEWNRDDGWLEGGLFLVWPFTYDVTDSELPYDLTLRVWTHEGRLACEDIEVTQRRGGPPVTTDGLRSATIEAYLDEIRKAMFNAEDFSFTVLKSPPKGSRLLQSPTAEEWVALDRFQRPRRPTDELLPHIAAAYREALRSSDPQVAKAPTAAVAQQLHYSRGHASRLVSEARKAGLLDPARRGRPGEVKTPARKRAAKTTKKSKKTTTTVRRSK